MLTNRRLSAEEALDWGIVTRVVEDAELSAEAEKLAQQLASGPTLAFGAVKKLLALSFESSLEAQLEHESQAISEAAVTADGREGVAAFFAKRAADFRGA
jgi:2-(1,2-epoxy-1,2-dihydrophenyl)acetyl-CoA isomerase